MNESEAKSYLILPCVSGRKISHTRRNIPGTYARLLALCDHSTKAYHLSLNKFSLVKCQNHIGGVNSWLEVSFFCADMVCSIPEFTFPIFEKVREYSSFYCLYKVQFGDFATRITCSWFTAFTFQRKGRQWVYVLLVFGFAVYLCKLGRGSKLAHVLSLSKFAREPYAFLLVLSLLGDLYDCRVQKAGGVAEWPRSSHNSM